MVSLIGSAGRHFVCGLVAVTMLVVAGAAVADPTVAPDRLGVLARVGWKVDKTTGGTICVVASNDECQAGQSSGEPDGFSYLSGTTFDKKTGYVYIADKNNNRVQELTGTGAFVAMFGWDVNGTRDGETGATQAEKNVCTEQEIEALGVKCEAGVAGTAAGQFQGLTSIAVDPATGDIYTQEVAVGNFRVDKYTPDGRFVWMIGKDVNQTTKGDICTEREIGESGVRCRGGVESASGSGEHRVFRFGQFYGNLLAVGGPKHLLYVGDERRVQEFDANGRWKRDIPLSWRSSAPRSEVEALAVDRVNEVYVAYQGDYTAGGSGGQATVVRKYDPAGHQISQFGVTPLQATAQDEIAGIAVDPAGRLAAVGPEVGTEPLAHFGRLYDGATGRLMTEFVVPRDNDGIGFDDHGDLYVTATDEQALIVYLSIPTAMLITSPVVCMSESGSDAFAAFNCALDGEASVPGG